MDRRRAVKRILIASGGLITLPFWMEGCRTGEKNTHASSFSPEEQDILAAITDTLIPAGKTTHSAGKTAADAGQAIGALAVGVDKFLQKLIDDCYEKPIQENGKKQLRAVEDSAKTAWGKSFAACTSQQRQVILLQFQDSKDKAAKDFFNLIKSETIRGFNTSQQVKRRIEK